MLTRHNQKMSIDSLLIDDQKTYLVDHIMLRVVPHRSRSLAKSRLVKEKKLQPIQGAELRQLSIALGDSGYVLANDLLADPRPATKKVVVYPEAHELLTKIAKQRTQHAVYAYLETIGDVFLNAVSSFLEEPIEEIDELWDFWEEMAIVSTHFEEALTRKNRAYLRVNKEAADKIDEIAKTFKVPSSKLMSAFILTQINENTPTQLDLIKSRSEILLRKIELLDTLTA